MSEPELPLVLIPGIGSGVEMYDPVADGLLPHRNVTGFNLPGYGDAPALESYGFADLARLLAEKLERMGARRVHVLGHSIGGMAAQEFALACPERTASVILSGTTPSFGGRDQTFAQQFLAARLKPLDDGMTMAELAQRFVPELVGEHINDIHRRLAIAAMARVPEAAYRAAMACLVTFNRRADISRITCPALLIAGELDRNAPVKTMAWMAEKMANARLEVMAGVGHLAPLERPADFARLVLDFLEEIDR